jgi:hypothetical protein
VEHQSQVRVRGLSRSGEVIFNWKAFEFKIVSEVAEFVPCSGKLPVTERDGEKMVHVNVETRFAL